MNIYEYIGNNLLISAGLIISLLLLIFNELKIKKQHIATVDPFKAVQLINIGANVLDLRSADIFKKGHIVNSKNMTEEQISSKKKSLGNKTTIIVCETGESSSKLVNNIRSSGVESVYGIRGGINSWSEANMPLVSKNKK
tara:strand:+ start:834 stop:1253 length:420 start_codon:yes stop_codon:yes gene_type:complete